MLEAFSMIRVHRLLFVIALAAGLVSNFSHVHRHSVSLHLSTSSNPDSERNMDLTAFVTLIDEFVTHGTQFKLCALVFNASPTSVFSVGQKPNEGPGQDDCIASGIAFPPAWYTMPSLHRATTTPPLCHP